MSLLLPLYSETLHQLGTEQHIYLNYIEQAVKFVIRRQRQTESNKDEHNNIKNLIVSVSCDEIQQNKDCIDKIWARIQSVLGRLYVRQLQTAYALEEPLFDCHIIFEDLCGYKVEKEPYITAIVCSSAENAQQIREIPESQQQNFERIELSLAGNEEDERKDTQQQPLQQHFLHEDEINNKPCSFKRIAVGGTFDHLHAGHKILLTMTAILAQQSMVVGVTDDCMLLKKKHRELIAPTMDRVHQVKHYLRTIVKRNIQYDVVPIKDPFGPTVTDSTIDALVVSKETLKGGDLGNDKMLEKNESVYYLLLIGKLMKDYNVVNNERDMRGLSPLKLRIIDVISTNDASIAQNEDMDILKISSSWIREYIAKTTSSFAAEPRTATITIPAAVSPASVIDTANRNESTSTPDSTRTAPVASSTRLL